MTVCTEVISQENSFAEHFTSLSEKQSQQYFRLLLLPDMLLVLGLMQLTEKK